MGFVIYHTISGEDFLCTQLEPKGIKVGKRRRTLAISSICILSSEVHFNIPFTCTNSLMAHGNVTILKQLKITKKGRSLKTGYTFGFYTERKHLVNETQIL